MHSMPRSSADILASATRAPCIVKRSRKPYQERRPDSSAPPPSFNTFSQREPDTPDVNSTPRPVSELAVTMTENIYANSVKRTHYIPPVDFKFVPHFAPEAISETPERSDQDQVDSTSSGFSIIPDYTISICIFCRSFFREPLERDEEPSPPTEPCRQTIDEVLTVLQKNNVNPFDLILELLDESRPEYACYRTEFYNRQNDQLKRILHRVSSNAAGRSKLVQILNE